MASYVMLGAGCVYSVEKSSIRSVPLGYFSSVLVLEILSDGSGPQNLTFFLIIKIIFMSSYSATPFERSFWQEATVSGKAILHIYQSDAKWLASQGVLQYTKSISLPGRCLSSLSATYETCNPNLSNPNKENERTVFQTFRQSTYW